MPRVDIDGVQRFTGTVVKSERGVAGPGGRGVTVLSDQVDVAAGEIISPASVVNSGDAWFPQAHWRPSSGTPYAYTPYPAVVPGTRSSASSWVGQTDSGGKTITGTPDPAKIFPSGLNWFVENAVGFHSVSPGLWDPTVTYQIRLVNHATGAVLSSASVSADNSDYLQYYFPAGHELNLPDDTPCDIDFSWIDSGDNSVRPLYTITNAVTFFAPRRGATPNVGVRDDAGVVMTGAFTSVSPNNVPRSPQTPVPATLTGSNFNTSADYQVRVELDGNIQQVQATVADANTLTFMMPTGGPVTVDRRPNVTLLWQDDSHDSQYIPLQTADDVLTYAAQQIGTITGFSPTTLSMTDDTAITITGSGFAPWAAYGIVFLTPDGGNVGTGATYVDANTLSTIIQGLSYAGFTGSGTLELTVVWRDAGGAGQTALSSKLLCSY